MRVPFPSSDVVDLTTNFRHAHLARFARSPDWRYVAMGGVEFIWAGVRYYLLRVNRALPIRGNGGMIDNTSPIP